ncbi:MAG: porin [Balneolaceae bacterium]
MQTKRVAFSLVIPALLFLMLAGFPFHTVTAQNAEPDEFQPSFKLGGFLQQHFVSDESDGIPPRFSIYRARLGVSGTVTDRIRVNVIGGYTEPPDNTPRLVNAFIDFDIHPLLQVRTGQFLLPFGLEGPEVIIFNPAIERSTAIRRLNTFAMFRDIGIQVSGRRSIFNYAVAVVNGRGANLAEQNDPKDVMGRIGLTPYENLEIGVSAHSGKYQSNPAFDNNESRFRLGADFSYTGDPVFVRGEYILRRDDQPSGDTRKLNGGYLLAGWQFLENSEAIARYEHYSPEGSLADNTFTAFTIGTNYYFVGNTRLSVNYEFRDDQLNPNLGNGLTFQMQVAI